MKRNKNAHIVRFGLLVIPAILAGQAQAQSRDRQMDVAPYLEVAQVVAADLSNGSDVLTYSTVAAGIDTSIQTRNAEAQVNLRYEHRFSYDNNESDEDLVTGIARGSVQLVPNLLSLEAGALASRTRVDLRGESPSNLVGNQDNVTQVYSVYAGPTLATQVGELSVNANYRAGYTKLESKTVGTLPPGQAPIDQFDDSISHTAGVSVGMQPGTLPFGWEVSGGYEREDAGQLDNRLEGKYARADVTVPITETVALVGGVGYEDVEITERDALRDANGDPVVGDDGRLVTNKASPRLLAYESDGLIWDAGVMWRPSRRTSVTASVGERYGSMSYTGSLSYQPTENSAFGVSVFDTVSGFGGLVNDSLAQLPTQFQSGRNPLSGDLNGCAFGGTSSLCLNDALQSAASSSFRARGVQGSYTTTQGAWNVGLGAGYTRRDFFASRLGALAANDGVVDESYYANLGVGLALDEKSDISTNVYASYLDSGLLGAPGVLGVGGNAAYYRQIFRGLSGTAAVGIDHYKQDGFDSETTASALVGLRYDF